VLVFCLPMHHGGQKNGWPKVASFLDPQFAGYKLIT